MEVYIVVSRDWGYDDQFYYPSEGYHVKKAYRFKEEAEEQAKALDREFYQDILNKGSLEAYLGEDPSCSWPNVEKVLAEKDIDIYEVYNLSVDELGSDTKNKLIQAACEDTPQYAVLTVEMQ